MTLKNNNKPISDVERVAEDKASPSRVWNPRITRVSREVMEKRTTDDSKPPKTNNMI